MATPAFLNRPAALGMCQAEVTRATRAPPESLATTSDSSSVSRAVFEEHDSLRAHAERLGGQGETRTLGRAAGGPGPLRMRRALRKDLGDPDRLDGPAEAEEVESWLVAESPRHVAVAAAEHRNRLRSLLTARGRGRPPRIPE